MNKEDCIFLKINLLDQFIDVNTLQNVLNDLYKNIVFSTFPYLKYNLYNSKKCIQKYNSGNCISFCYYIQMHLEEKYNIKSFVIPSSVPSIYKVMGTPNICHCALMIPLNTNEFYIIDSGLYYVEPIFCSFSNNISRNTKINLIAQHEQIDITYQIEKCNYFTIDLKYNQTIPNETSIVKTKIMNDECDYWEYYLCEIKNPDLNIGHSYLKFKNEPFLLYTNLDKNVVKLLYKLYILKNVLFIKKYPENIIIYKGNTCDNNENYIRVIKILKPYLTEYIL